jgi:hypothetical protein
MSIAVFKHDTAVKLRISLTDGGKPYSITQGCRAVFHGKRPDDRELVEPCMIQGNTEIIYTFSNSTAAKEGVVNCQLRLYGEIEEDNELITAPRFTIVVDDRIVNDTDIELDDGETVQSALDRIIASENTREGNEAQRILNDAARDDAEEARAKAEGDRIDAELRRAENEALRVEAEQNRGAVEAVYAKYEMGRQNAEAGRCSAEEERIQSELARIQAEKDRDGFEELRIEAEANRDAAETERWKAEQGRLQTEKARADAEDLRVTAEEGRCEDEKNRNTEELQRKKHENERLQNEANRVAAENERAAQLGIHNTANDAHQDIRNALSDLSETVGELMGADKETLEDIQEIVGYAKENKDLIDGLITSKVNVSDVVDNLTTNDSTKVLSAAQGVALKNSIALVDAKAKEVDNKVPSLTITGKLRHVYLYDSNQVKNSSMPAKTGYEGSEDTDTIVSRGSSTHKNHPGTFVIMPPHVNKYLENGEKNPAYSENHPMTVGVAEGRYAKKTDLNSYAKTTDLSGYLKATDADKKYMPKDTAPDMTGYATVAQLEALKAELTFVPLEITSFYASPSVVEINKKSTVTLHFALNKPFSGLKFNGETPDASSFTYAADLKSGSYTVPCQLTSQMAFTLEATCGKDDQKETDTATTSLSVSRQICYGAYGELDSTSEKPYQDLFDGLSETKNTNHYGTSRYFTFTAAPTSEQYFYCLVPTWLGTCKFVAGNFPAQLSLMATGKDEEGKDIYTVNITNSNNYEESYYVYRSEGVGNGVTTEITVSGG